MKGRNGSLWDACFRRLYGTCKYKVEWVGIERINMEATSKRIFTRTFVASIKRSYNSGTISNLAMSTRLPIAILTFVTYILGAMPLKPISLLIFHALKFNVVIYVEYNCSWLFLCSVRFVWNETGTLLVQHYHFIISQFIFTILLSVKNKMFYWNKRVWQ